MINRSAQSRRFLDALHSDNGGAAISFILCFPIFLLFVAIIVQFAILVNAKVTVDYAARMAARSAVTALPDQRPECVTSAACMALVNLSPPAKTSVTPEAQALAESLTLMGTTISSTFAARYTYAQDATQVTWTPQANFLRSEAQDLQVRLTYRCYLTVPAAKKLLGSINTTVAGISGDYFDIGSTCTVETAHGRQTQTNGDGWPSGVPIP